jgi:glycosyltransferase involved in cell wall biosynthesis
VKRVAIVNCVYPPEPVVSAHIGADLAAYLTRNGASVTVLCPFPTRPHGAAYPDHARRAQPQITRERGADVVRLPSFTAPESRLLPRLWESYSFGRHVSDYLDHHLTNVDVVYANAWPLPSQALIARWCVRRRIPLVLHIQDVYPESWLNRLPGAARALIGGPLVAMDRRTVHQATRVVVISANMHHTYVEDRGLPAEKVVTIFDWQDESLFEDLPARQEVHERERIPSDRFTFMYLGNIGPVAGVEFLITAFARASLTHAQLVIAGAGSNKQACEALAQKLGVDTVHFIACPTPRDAAILQQMSDVCLLPLRRGAGMSSIPSKLMAYLLSAKPVLAPVDAGSDTAHCIDEAACGWVGEPEDVQWLAAKMSEVAVLPEAALSAMGARGRSYALENFSKAANVRRLAALVLAP